MADKTQQLVLEALHRAAAAPAGMPLVSGRNLSGLFAASAAARQAAELCKQQGYVQVVRNESRGKSSCEICVISEKGLALLLAESSPKNVLESLVHALEHQRARAEATAETLRLSQATLLSLKGIAERVLEHIQHGTPAPQPSTNGQHGVAENVLESLHAWQNRPALGDCPLPTLHRGLVHKHPKLSIGKFHDELRRLHDGERIYLHPWTGPLYEIPEPQLALMVGHEIAWYASLRMERSSQ